MEARNKTLLSPRSYLTLSEAARAPIPLRRAPIDGCGSCAAVCPTAAILVATVARVLGAECIGCGQCVVCCPQGAIVLDHGRAEAQP